MYVWCVRVVRKREDRVVVGETVKDQSDKFLRSVIVKKHPDVGRSCVRGRSAHTSSDVDSSRSYLYLTGQSM